MSLDIDTTYLLGSFGLGALLSGLLVYTSLRSKSSKSKHFEEELEKKQLKIDRLNAKLIEIQEKLSQGSGVTKSTSFTQEQIKKIEELQNLLQKEQKKVLEAKKIAQEASQVKYDFLANIRHEIRTPMNSIMVFSEILRTELQDSTHKTYAANILQSGSNLLSLLDEIIELSNLQSGVATLDEKAVDIHLLFETIVEEEKAQARKKFLALNLIIDDDVPQSVILDDEKVKDIVSNFIENALKFTQQGSIDVRVSADRMNVINNTINLSISVTDTGMGIEKKNFKTIFEIFDKRDDGNEVEFQSTGLGLSINKKMATLMGGDILLESELSKGSKFTLLLKDVEIVLENENSPEIETQELDFNLIKPDGANLMIIDEPQESRGVVIDSFEGTNVKVYHYNNPREAIDVLKIKEMDLILIDLDLLIADENAVSKVIAKISKAPVVTLTTRVLKNIVFSKNGVEVVGHMKKPISKMDLFKITLKLLNSKHYLNNSKKENMQNDFFNSIDKQRAQDFSILLEKSVNVLYEDAKKTNDLANIKSFAKILLEVSQQYKMQVFVDFANELLEKIDLFDIGAISNLMDEYKQLLASLQSQT